MIYKDDYGDELRIDVGKSLLGASSMEIIITKPSGAVLAKTATQYGTTTQITYTTILGDMDESGTYRLNARVQWSGAKLTGDTVYLDVEELGSISQAQVIAAISAYTYIDSIQSKDEFNDTENTEAEILFPQFSILLKRAKGELLKDLANRDNLALSHDDELACLCYLIAKYTMERDPSWSASSVSQPGGGSVSRSSVVQGGKVTTDPQKSYEFLLDKAEANETGTEGLISVDDEVQVHDDETYFQEVREGGYDPET